MKLFIGALLVLHSSAVFSTEWNCRNLDLEVSCAQEKCEASDSDGFTPLEVSFYDNGSISIGMYSGIWKGKVKVHKEENYILVIGKDLVFSTSPDQKEDFLIAIDTNDMIAIFKGLAYAMPMRCQKREGKE